MAKHFGYGLADLGWLKLSDLDYLVPDETKKDTQAAGAQDSDAAFSL